ncbi:hypothetical protein [Brachybacterium huguangmaarense]
MATSRRTARAALLLAPVLLLAACGSDDGGDSPATSDAAPASSAAPSASAIPSVSATPSASGSQGGSPSASPSAGTASAGGSVLESPGDPDGALPESGILDFYGEPDPSGPTTFDPAAGNSDGTFVTVGDVDYSMSCSGTAELGAAPISCTFTDPAGAELAGDATVLRIAGEKGVTIPVFRIIGSASTDPTLDGIGETPVIVGPIVGDSGGTVAPKDVTADALAQALVDGYNWNFSDGAPAPRVPEVTCTLEDGGLTGTCEASGADERVDGRWRATYHRNGLGDSVYLFSPIESA